MSTAYLISLVVLSILILLVLVIRFRVNAFIGLLLVSIITGLAAGMPPEDLLTTIQTGMGSILGFVAIIIGLGAIFGEMLEFSGGGQALAHYLVGRFGQKNASYALTFTGFLVAIPVFFDVGFIIIVPVVYALSRETGRSMVYYAVPLLVGLGITHAFIPPTPGPVAVTEILGADLGWVILLGCCVGLPLAVILGPFLGRWIGSRVIAFPKEIEPESQSEGPPPSFGAVFTIIAFPIVLIVARSLSQMGIENRWFEESWLLQMVGFIGHPFVALILVTFLSMYYLGYKRGADANTLLRLSTKALGPAGIIILITGAGGVYKQVLVDSGVGTALASSLAQTAIPYLLLAYLIAVVVRVTQGSATVAMITAAGLVTPLVEGLGLSEPKLALIVLAIASGATILSHVNDSGFWMVGKYLYLTEKQTIQTWTVASTIISISGILLILLISLFL